MEDRQNLDWTPDSTAEGLTPEMGTPASEPDLWRNRKKVHLDAIIDIDCLIEMHHCAEVLGRL